MNDVIPLFGESKDGDSALRRILKGEKHRLCFDFSNIPALQAFFDKCKADAITHRDSVPILMFQDDNKTIWVVGSHKTKKNPDGTLIQKL